MGILRAVLHCSVAIYDIHFIKSFAPTHTHTHSTLAHICQTDGLQEGSLRAIQLYPVSVDDPNTNFTQRDAQTAIDFVQNTFFFFFFFFLLYG